eukprot:3760489-Pleurochrysis_carterae.AAC.2
MTCTRPVAAERKRREIRSCLTSSVFRRERAQRISPVFFTGLTGVYARNVLRDGASTCAAAQRARNWDWRALRISTCALRT